MSPGLQTVFGVLDRLPATFSTFFHDQIRDWDLLFPAEKRYYERLFGLIGRTDAAEVERLFTALREVERRMGVNERSWPRRQFTLDQVDFLNRSPQYPEWRKAVADIFAKLDPILDAETARHGRARLAVVVSPADLPVSADRMWQRLRDRGKLVTLESPAPDFTGPLSALAGSHARAPYDTWILETGAAFHPAAGVVALGYERLKTYRERLMDEVQKIVESENIRGPRQLGARLKQLKIRASEGDLSRDPVTAEFTRAVLLSGNGTLLLNNTFVEWATIQAVRRARPSMTIVSFGIRNKVKPFSSLLIYADQEKTSPIPSQVDTLGSYVDLEIFYQYVWQEFEKYPEYRMNTAYLFLAEGMDAMFVIAPGDFPLLSAKQPVRTDEIFVAARQWMGL